MWFCFIFSRMAAIHFLAKPIHLIIHFFLYTFNPVQGHCGLLPIPIVCRQEERYPTGRLPSITRPSWRTTDKQMLTAADMHAFALWEETGGSKKKDKHTRTTFKLCSLRPGQTENQTFLIVTRLTSILPYRKCATLRLFFLYQMYRRCAFCI